MVLEEDFQSFSHISLWKPLIPGAGSVLIDMIHVGDY